MFQVSDKIASHDVDWHGILLSLLELCFHKGDCLFSLKEIKMKHVLMSQVILHSLIFHAKGAASFDSFSKTERTEFTLVAFLVGPRYPQVGN